MNKKGIAGGTFVVMSIAVLTIPHIFTEYLETVSHGETLDLLIILVALFFSVSGTILLGIYYNKSVKKG